jgi:hypothetical protein
MARVTKSKSKSKSVEAMDVDPAALSELDVEGAIKDNEGEEEVAEDAEEEDDEEEQEGEYEVEKVLDHKQKAVSGEPPSMHMTHLRANTFVSINARPKSDCQIWWPGKGMERSTTPGSRKVTCEYSVLCLSTLLNASDHAEEAVSAYWATRPKKSIKNEPATKRARPSKAPNATPKPRATQGRSKRKSPVDDDDDIPGYDETHNDDLQKYLDVEDWEDLVASVDTIERGHDETLVVYMTMYVPCQSLLIVGLAGKKAAWPQKSSTSVVLKR